MRQAEALNLSRAVGQRDDACQPRWRERNAGRKRRRVAVRVGGRGGEIGVARGVGENHDEADVAAGIGGEVRGAEKNLTFADAAAVAGGVAEKLQAIHRARSALERAVERDVAPTVDDTGDDRVGLRIVRVTGEFDPQAAVGENGIGRHSVACTGSLDQHTIALIGGNDISLHAEVESPAGVKAAHRYAMRAVAGDDIPRRRSRHGSRPANQNVG